MRPTPTLLLLIAVLAYAAWTLGAQSRTSEATSDPWRAVPEHTAAVISLPEAHHSWQRLASTSQLWQALGQLPAGAALERFMVGLAVEAEQDAAFATTLEAGSALVALMHGNADAMGVLCIISTGQADSRDLAPMARMLGASTAADAPLWTGAPVQVQADSTTAPFTLCHREDLWLLASHPAVMDEALAQWASDSAITRHEDLQQAMSTLGRGSDAHLLVHGERAARLLNTWWKATALEGLDLPRAWAAMDVRFRPEGLLMGGLIRSDAKDLLASQGTGRQTLARVLPDRVSMLDLRHIADPTVYLKERGVQHELAPVLFHWVSGTMALATGTDSAGDLMHWGVLPATDADAAADALAAIRAARSCDTLTHRERLLVRPAVGAAYETMLGPAWEAMEEPWCTVLGHAVVMSNSSTGLRMAIDAWTDGGSLAEDARGASFFERMAAEAGRTWWCDVARARPILLGDLKETAAEKVTAHTAFFDELGGMALQLSPAQRGTQLITFTLLHAPFTRLELGTLWSAPLQAGLQRAPDILHNHVTGGREVLVQDEEHRLSLVGGTGTVLWERQLEGPILGAVRQVDRYRNGKLQMLFNTAGSVYLVDRLGRDVQGFPVKLTRPATAPLALFDYDGTRDYRVLLPDAEGHLLVLGIDGKAVEGWEAARMPAPAGHAAEHLRIRNKDHIVVVDDAGQVHVLDRRGRQRYDARLRLAPGFRLLDMRAGNEIGGSTLRWQTEDGAVMQGTLDGATTQLAAPAPGMSTFATLGSPGQEMLVRMHDDSLIVSQNGRPVFTRVFAAPLRGMPITVPLSRNGYAIGILQGGNISLVDELGHDLPGTPLPGNSPFAVGDLDMDGTTEVVTTHAEGHLVAHRLHTGEELP